MFNTGIYGGIVRCSFKYFVQCTKTINFGLVRMYVTPYCIFWIIFTSNLVISYTDKVGYSDCYKLCSSCSRFVLFCYERDFMTSLSDDIQADIIEAFNSTSRYLDLLNIDIPYFEGMVNQIYPPELQFNKANTSDTEAPFFKLHLSFSNGFVSSNIYDKRDDFDFDIARFPFSDGDVPRRPSDGMYISQLTYIRLARVCSHVGYFNTRNKCLTAKLLKQGYRYHKLRKAFSKFYRRHQLNWFQNPMSD